jgi:tetratricopeptide (TPR) repeat protein
LATKYYQLGENRKSRVYLERLIQTPGVNRDQLSSAYLHLSKISREEGGNEWKEYARQRIKLLEAKKDKTIDTIQQLATEHFQLGNYRESEMNLKSITQSKEATRDQSFHAHFCLAEIAQTTGRRNWRTHYLRAIQLLQTKRQKSHEDIYRIASLYKRLGDYRSSNRWFRRLLSVTKQQPLISGSYFHLGETCYFQSRLQEAKTYFEKCLRLNPGHRRAREYMSELA